MWILFSLLAGLSRSFKEVYGKFRSNRFDEYVISWGMKMVMVILLLPILFFIEIPPLNYKFYINLVVVGFLSTITAITYFKAIKSSDLSITIPFMAFTPLFMLITSPIIIGEFPGPMGLVGVLLIVAGSYVLNFAERKIGYLEPFKKLLREKGPRYMLLTALLWSVQGNLDKIGIGYVGPYLWVLFLNLFGVVVLSFLVFYKKERIKQIKNRKDMLRLVPLGIFGLGDVLFNMIAIQYTLVVYVISIKRFNIVFSALLGFFIFKEKHMKERLVGIIIMMVGVLMIGFS